MPELQEDKNLFASFLSNKEEEPSFSEEKEAKRVLFLAWPRRIFRLAAGGIGIALGVYWGGCFAGMHMPITPSGGGTLSLTAGQTRDMSVLVRWRGDVENDVVQSVLADAVLRSAKDPLPQTAELRLRAIGVRIDSFEWHSVPSPPDPAAARIAAARADAAALLLQTDAKRAKIFADAHAASAERVAFAQKVTATVNALPNRTATGARPAILADLYRDRIAQILKQAGSVSTVDPKSVSRLILPDPAP